MLTRKWVKSEDKSYLSIILLVPWALFTLWAPPDRFGKLHLWVAAHTSQITQSLYCFKLACPSRCDKFSIQTTPEANLHWHVQRANAYFTVAGPLAISGGPCGVITQIYNEYRRLHTGLYWATEAPSGLWTLQDTEKAIAVYCSLVQSGHRARWSLVSGSYKTQTVTVSGLWFLQDTGRDGPWSLVPTRHRPWRSLVSSPFRTQNGGFWCWHGGAMPLMFRDQFSCCSWRCQQRHQELP